MPAVTKRATKQHGGRYAACHERVCSGSSTLRGASSGNRATSLGAFIRLAADEAWAGSTMARLMSSHFPHTDTCPVPGSPPRPADVCEGGQLGFAGLGGSQVIGNPEELWWLAAGVVIRTGEATNNTSGTRSPITNHVWDSMLGHDYQTDWGTCGTRC